MINFTINTKGLLSFYFCLACLLPKPGCIFVQLKTIFNYGEQQSNFSQTRSSSQPNSINWVTHIEEAEPMLPTIYLFAKKTSSAASL